MEIKRKLIIANFEYFFSRNEFFWHVLFGLCFRNALIKLCFNKIAFKNKILQKVLEEKKIIYITYAIAVILIQFLKIRLFLFQIILIGIICRTIMHDTRQSKVRKFFFLFYITRNIIFYRNFMYF